MMLADDWQRLQALEAAQRRLHLAAMFAEMHCSKPPFKRYYRRFGGVPSVWVQFEWPGVLRVFDASTGELLAESKAGAPKELSPTFVPGK